MAAPFLITPRVTGLSHPAVAVDPAGTAHVVWKTSGTPASGDALHYCRIPRGATACAGEQTFALTVTDPANSFEIGGPWVFAPDADRVILLTHRCCPGFAAYPSSRVSVALISTDHGTTFPTQKVVGNSEPTGDAQFGPGESISTVSDSVTNGLHYQAGPLTTPAPTVDANLSTSAGEADRYDGTVGFADAATPIAAWDDLTHIFTRRYGGSGDLNTAGNWAPVPATDLGAGTRPRLAGTYMFYKPPNGAPADSGVFVRRYALGAFGAAGKVGDSASDNSWDAVVDGSGRVHVAWVNGGEGSRIRYRSSADGTTWTTPTTLTPDQSFIGLEISAAPDGRGLAVWFGRDGVLGVPLESGVPDVPSGPSGASGPTGATGPPGPAPRPPLHTGPTGSSATTVGPVRIAFESPRTCVPVPRRFRLAVRPRTVRSLLRRLRTFGTVRVRRVDFSLDGRRILRDTRAPFEATVSTAAMTRGSRHSVRAQIRISITRRVVRRGRARTSTRFIIRTVTRRLDICR